MKRGKTESIDKVLGLFLKQSGLGVKYKEMEVVDAWKDVIGVSVANRTKKIYIQGGKLYVKINSSIVKNQLLMMKEGIISALNQKVKEEIVKEIIIY